MRRANSSAVLLTVIVFSMFQGCKEDAETSNIDNLTLKPGKESCGWSGRYVKMKSLHCPKTHRIDRHPNCPVESYKEISSLDCPGSIPADSYTEVTNGSKGSHCRTSNAADVNCRAGYNKASNVTENAICVYARGGRTEIDIETSYISKRTITCARAESLNHCRLVRPDNVEQYSACELTWEPPVDYQECEHDSHGKIWNECQVYLENEEAVKIFIDFTKSDMGMNSLNLITLQAEYLKLIKHQIGLACLINKIEGSRLYSALTEDLKMRYKDFIDKEYISSDCASIDTGLIDKQCSSALSANACDTLTAYQNTRLWFQERISDLQKLISDVVASNNTTIKNNLDGLKNELVNLLKEADKKAE